MYVNNYNTFFIKKKLIVTLNLQIENDHKNGLLSNDQFNNQKLETLFALNSLEQALSNEEQNYLKENIKEDAENDLGLFVILVFNF